MLGKCFGAVGGLQLAQFQNYSLVYWPINILYLLLLPWSKSRSQAFPFRGIFLFTKCVQLCYRGCNAAGLIFSFGGVCSFISLCCVSTTDILLALVSSDVLLLGFFFEYVPYLKK